MYEEYIRGQHDTRDKYNAYLLIQRLIGLADEEFSREFNVNDEEGVEILVELIKEEKVKSLDQLSLKAAVAKHVEQSDIYLNFLDTFRLEDISDDIVIKMLENVENRL